jgi:hypothetical protein
MQDGDLTGGGLELHILVCTHTIICVGRLIWCASRFELPVIRGQPTVPGPRLDSGRRPEHRNGGYTQGNFGRPYHSVTSLHLTESPGFPEKILVI